MYHGFRLVADLGLHSNLNEYNVPTGDLESIASAALGNQAHGPITIEIVTQMLEGLYSDSNL